MPGMSDRKFRDAVERYSGLEQDDPFVRAAIQTETEKWGVLRQERIQAVADKAGELARGYMPVPRDKDRNDERVAYGPGLNAEAALISKAFAKRLETWARELRERCFDTSRPPFQGEAAASVWIESESAADRERWKKRSESTRDTHEEIRRLADLAGVDAKLEMRWLRYYKAGSEFTQLAPAFPGTILEKLAGEINRVSEETAFHPVVLTAFVLWGAAPTISRIRITETAKTCRISEDRILSRWVTVRFNAADVTDVELRALYKDIREFFGATNRNRLTWTEYDFLALVDSNGGWPERDKTQYWEEVLRQWKEMHATGSLTLNSWRAVRNKYEALTSRTNVRELMTPNPPPPPMGHTEFAKARKRAEELAHRYPPRRW